VKKINIHARRPQPRGLTDRDAVHALHGKDRRGAVIPMHFRDLQQVLTAGIGTKISPQLTAIGGFTQQIQFIVQVFIEFIDDFARF